MRQEQWNNDITVEKNDITKAMLSLKQLSSHVDCFEVTGCTWNGHGDHLKYSQWLQSSQSECVYISGMHYDGNALSFNPGLQYPHLHGPVHTPDNNGWDTPPV